jgi:uncharacterized protein involved in high-affinity Fe2+ transport
MKPSFLWTTILALPAGLALAQGSSPTDQQEQEDLTRGAAASFQALDGDGDGRVSPQEAATDSVLTEVFAKADRNADGFVDGDEYLRYSQARAKAQLTLPGG